MCVGDEYEDLRLFGGAVADFADRRRVPFGNNVKKQAMPAFLYLYLYLSQCNVEYHHKRKPEGCADDPKVSAVTRHRLGDKLAYGDVDHRARRK